MCTVTVRLGEGPLLVTMNRDERVERAPEIPPSRREAERGGPSWIAPTDGQAGGTWIGANDRGVVACLLNAYLPGDPVELPPPGTPSRGQIIPRMLADPGAGLDPEPYPSFLLVVATPARGEILRWTRKSLRREPLARGWNLITSSGLEPEEVALWRADRFEAWRRDGEPMPEGVPSYHLLDDPAKREWSPWMTRTWSATRSLTQVRCDTAARAVTLRWWARRGDAPVALAAPDAVLGLDLVP